MKVLKRNGQIQDFDLSKIKKSLECTSNDMGQILTQGDIVQITNAVKDYIDANFENQISYIDIHNSLIMELEKLGFGNVAKAYNEFSESFVNKK